MGQQLERLLQSCTVKLSIPGKTGWGTGFFVAPGLILTCHHVVKDLKNGTVHVCWQNQEDFTEAIVERSLPELDLALLRFSPSVVDLPCVYLDESFQADDSLYTYGYPDDFPQGASVTGKCEGIATDKQPLIKFKAGQVRPGLSGSPLLNQRTGKVCGIVKFTRDRSIDLGGGAVPTSEILSQFPELPKLQQAFHRRDNRWTKLIPSPSSRTHLYRQEYRNRQILLNKVNQFWVKGVLERSLQNQVMIELGLEERPNTLAQPWNRVLQTSNEEPTSLPQGTKVIDLFDEIGEGRTLLILGEPGSGKTTTLLELTRDLIARAEQDIDHLIPVVFNLSSWAVKKQKIEDWLVEELKSKYQVSKKYGRALVNKDKLLLLLDGLDEVQAEYREECINALNQFQFNRDHFPEIVVCSRIKDYEALSNRLNFQSAVYLRLLTLEQIHHYLNSLGSGVTGLRTLVEEDKTLQELAQSPLILNIMTLAYQGVAVEDLPKTDVAEERRKQLFDDYIEKMFKRRGPSQRFLDEKVKRWLIWLAQKMLQKSQTVFLIERIQPSWLSSLRQKWSYQLGVLLLVSMTVWLAIALIDYLLEPLSQRLMMTQVEKIFDNRIPFYSFLIDYDYSIVKISFGLIPGLVIGLGQTIKPIETLKFSGVEAWRGTIRGLRKWSIVGLSYLTFFGLIAGFLVGLIFLLSLNISEVMGLGSDELAKWSRVGQIAGTLSGLIAAVTAGLIARSSVKLPSWRSRRLSSRLRFALISGLIVFLSLSFSFPSPLSLALSLALPTGLGVAIIAGLSNGLSDRLVFKLVNTLIFSVTVGLIVGLGNGLSTWLIGGVLSNWKPGGELLDWIKLWLTGGLGFGVSGGLVTGLIARLRDKTNPAETLQGAGTIRNWLIIRLRQGLVVGVIVALILGLTLSFFIELDRIIIMLLLTSCIEMGLIVTLAFSTLFGLFGAFGGTLLFAVWGALIGMISGGLTGPDLERKTTPNQGIRQSALNVGVFAVIGGLTVGSIWGLMNFLPAVLITGLTPTASDWLSFGLSYVMISGLFCSLIPGAACFQHLTLRFILWKNKFIPWNYACFLNYATERIFLQKVGGGYIFIHRMLMEHFAEMELEN